LNILLLGPQGSGKGTQAKRIASEYGLAHVATGDMFRDAIARGTPLGRKVEPILASGQLVPDGLTIEVIRERLAEDHAREGFVLDGFPRNLVQAEALDDLLTDLGRPLDVIFEFQIPDEVCVQRLLKRARHEGRPDDTPEVIAERLRIYHEQTAPVIDHYRATGKLVGIHADRPIDAVWAEVQEALEMAAKPPSEAPIRVSGPGEGVGGNREVPPAGEARSVGGAST
jgi:adenylate kinase